MFLAVKDVNVAYSCSFTDSFELQIYTAVIISLNSAEWSILIILMRDLLLFHSWINRPRPTSLSSILTSLTSSVYWKGRLVNYKMDVHLNFMCIVF